MWFIKIQAGRIEHTELIHSYLRLLNTDLAEQYNVDHVAVIVQMIYGPGKLEA
jgi:hypothetical protein